MAGHAEVVGEALAVLRDYSKRTHVAHAMLARCIDAARLRVGHTVQRGASCGVRMQTPALACLACVRA
eukprot:scaffold2706_cov415-Prasinococcus_capsulatus_cf.AAC.4